MHDEHFDVVSERDEVIDRQLRGEVHRLGLRHRAVHVLVFNREGRIFLQKRSMAKDCWPGAWDSSASGHLGVGEKYDDCAQREVAEELGLELTACPRRLFKIDACAETGQEFVWVYRWEAEGPFALHPQEIDEGAWFSPLEVTKWISERPEELASGFRIVWQRLTALKHS